MFVSITNQIFRNILVLVLLASFVGLSAQSSRIKSDRRKRIEEQIRLSHKLLKETNFKQDKSLNELVLINKQIKLRESLVRQTGAEINTLRTEIGNLNNHICDLEEKINDLREHYAEIARASYKDMDDDNFFLNVLSANSLTNAYYRAIYFRQFSKMRQRKLDHLEESKLTLTGKREELTGRINEHKVLLDEKRQELALLKSSKTEQNSLFYTLRSKEEKYRKKLSHQRNSLRENIKKADKSYGKKLAEKYTSTPRKTATKSTTKKPTSSRPSNTATKASSTTSRPRSTAARTASTGAVGRSFKSQKGTLPWPIASNQGLVVGKFGLTEDAFGNRITNDGIFIRSKKGSKVNVVYDGEVTGVQKVPMSGTLVIIEHGSYRTVYANLNNVNVKQGQKVKRGQNLGTVRTDDRTQETTFQFMVYRLPGNFENPLRWISQ